MQSSASPRRKRTAGPRSARIDDLMAVYVLSRLVSERIITFGQVRNGFDLGPSFKRVLAELADRGLLEKVYPERSLPTDPTYFRSRVTPAVLARHLLRAVARTRQTEGGGM